MKEVIKFLGKKDDLVWIYPKNTIHKDATVNVDAGYQAIMIRNGEMDIPYFSGTNKVFNDKQSKFSLFNNKYYNDCNLYFFNLSPDVNVREWGTRNPIKYFDKRYKMELTMRGHGTYKVQLENPRLFLKSFKIDQQSIEKLESSIKDMVIAKITETIAKVLTKEEYDLLSIHANYDVITASTLEKLNQDFEQKGFSLHDLRISHLTPVEEEQIKALKDLQFKSAIFNSEFEMVNKVRKANNEDLLVKNTVNMHKNAQFHCSKCQSPINANMKFCSNCGEQLKRTEVDDVYV